LRTIASIKKKIEEVLKKREEIVHGEVPNIPEAALACGKYLPYGGRRRREAVGKSESLSRVWR